MKASDSLSLIVIYGPAGAGKTTVSELVQKGIGHAAHFGFDHIKRFILGFRENRSLDGITKKVVSEMAREYLKNGISVIVEQGVTNEELQCLKEIAEGSNARFFVYKISGSRNFLDKRANDRMDKLGKPRVPEETLTLLFEQSENVSYPDTRAFDAEKIDSQTIASKIIAQVGSI